MSKNLERKKSCLIFPEMARKLVENIVQNMPRPKSLFGLGLGGMKSTTPANSVQKNMLFGGILYFNSSSFISTLEN